MIAAVYRRFGGPDVVGTEDIRIPAPGRDEVLMRVCARTVSAADHRARSRDVPPGLWMLVALALGVFRPRRRVLGMDAAGIIVAVGEDVTTFQTGDEVIAMLGARFGGHAEYVCVPQGGAITAKPRNLTFEDAASLVFVRNAPFERVESSINPGEALLLVISNLQGMLSASRHSRRSGKLVTASVGGYTAEDLLFVAQLAEAGQYRAVVDRTYDLADVAIAHRFVDTGRKRGNVVVRVAASA